MNTDSTGPLGDDALLAELKDLLVSSGASRRIVRDLGIDEDLIDRGVLDSLSLVGLVVQAQKAFGIRVRPSELDASKFRTLRALRSFFGMRRIK